MSAGVRDTRASKRCDVRVASRIRARALQRVGLLTIADPLPRLAGHLVADQSALSKPIWHAQLGEGARGRSWGV